MPKNTKEYDASYRRDHCKQYNIRLSLEKDADIIDYIEQMRADGLPLNAFVKDALRDRIRTCR
jgi:hypothetical protein